MQTITEKVSQQIARKVAQLRESADRQDAQARESFDRCDTDGFLSQWALGLGAQRDRLEADILEAGGKAEFPALFTLSGFRARAKLITVPDKFNYGKPKRVWAFFDLNDKPTGKFITPFPKRASTMEKKGYREAPSWLLHRQPSRALAEGSQGMLG